MPEVARPDGAVLHYERVGRGYPLLLRAPEAQQVLARVQRRIGR